MHRTSDPVALHAEAVALREEGRFGRAARKAAAAVRGFERTDGRDHPDVANALLELGRVRVAQDRSRDALAAFRRAVRIMDKYVRMRDEVIRRLWVQAACALGGGLRSLSRYDEAEAILESAVARAERWLGRRDLDLAGALNELGILRKYQGRYPEAPPLYRRALVIVRGHGLAESALAASLYHNLGGLEHARRRYAAAEPPARRAFEVRARLLGPNHPDAAADLAALAAIVDARGRLAEAATLYRRAIAVFRRRCGPRSYEVSINLAALGKLAAKQGRGAAGERLVRQALAIQVRLLGARHHDLALTLDQLAFVQRARGREADARKTLARALTMYRRLLGDAHPHTRACRAALAEVARTVFG